MMSNHRDDTAFLVSMLTLWAASPSTFISQCVLLDYFNIAIKRKEPKILIEKDYQAFCWGCLSLQSSVNVNVTYLTCTECRVRQRAKFTLAYQEETPSLRIATDNVGWYSKATMVLTGVSYDTQLLPVLSLALKKGWTIPAIHPIIT